MVETRHPPNIENDYGESFKQEVATKQYTYAQNFIFFMFRYAVNSSMYLLK